MYKAILDMSYDYDYGDDDIEIRTLAKYYTTHRKICLNILVVIYLHFATKVIAQLNWFLNL